MPLVSDVGSYATVSHLNQEAKVVYAESSNLLLLLHPMWNPSSPKLMPALNKFKKPLSFKKKFFTKFNNFSGTFDWLCSFKNFFK